MLQMWIFVFLAEALGDLISLASSWSNKLRNVNVVKSVNLDPKKALSVMLQIM